MSKASKIGKTEPEKAVGFDGELIFLALPLVSYRALSDRGAKSGKSAAQVLQEAIETYLRGAP
jgi:hypothetical protein